MSDINSLSGMDELKDLQKRLNHDSIRHQFRTKLVGGLNEDDVTEYIENIEENVHKLEQEYKKGLDEIYTLRKKLNDEYSEKMSLQDSLDKMQHNLDTYIDEYKGKELRIQSLNEKGNAEIAQLNNEIHQMSEERIALEDKLNQYNLELKQARDYASEFEENNNALKLKIVDLEKENSSKDVLNNKIISNYNELEKQIELEKSNNEKLSTDLEMLGQKNINLEETVSRNLAEIEELQMISEKAEQELKKLLAESSIEIEQANDRAAKVEADNIAMKSRIADFEKEISSKDIQNDEINKLYNELEKKIQLEKSNNEKLNADLEMLGQKNINLEETVSQDLIEIEELRKISEKAEAELKKLLAESSIEIEQANDRAAKIEANNIAMKASIADFEKEISSKNIQNDEIISKYNELEKQIELEKSNNEKLNADLEMLGQKNINLEKTVSQNLIEIEELRKISEKAETELKKLLAESSIEIKQANDRAAKIEADNIAMKASIADFEKEISSKNIQNDEIISKYNELEKQIELEKSDNEQLSMQLDMYRQKVYDLEKTIAQNILAIEEQRMIGEKVEQELKLEKARGSNYKINMFKEELNNIYQKIEILEDESEQHVRTINELQQQLFAERLRANKADDDLSEFIKLVSGLKDKMFSEQNQLEKQVKMVMEKRNAQQPEMINDCLISWACEEKSVN